MKEIWKDVIGFEGFYQVSNLGRVKRLSREIWKNGKVWYTCKEIILKTYINKGYEYVWLGSGNSKTLCKMHRLVATHFIPNPDNLPLVNHKDENPSNNCVDNLEWCTHKYNMNYGTLIERKKHYNNKSVLCVETGETFVSTCEVKRRYGYDVSYIGSACKKNIMVYGYHWKYIKDCDE